MNNTTGQTQITVTTTKPQPKSEIKARIIYDARGNSRKVEFLRGVQI